MAGETQISVTGNLTSDPELRFIQSGAAVASFTIASTPRTFNKQSNEWVDGDTLFLRCSVWREAAENVAETLAKGMRVIAQGNLKMREYEKDGQKRTSTELEVLEIGPSLKYASAKVTRTQKGASQQPQGGFGGQPSQQSAPQQTQGNWGQPQGAPQQSAPSNDPWGNSNTGPAF